MRRVSIYSLILIYFMIGVRFTVNHHFCGGKYKSSTVVGFGNHKGCCKGKKMKKGCCDNIQHSIKSKFSCEQGHDPVTVPIIFIALTPDVVPVIQKTFIQRKEQNISEYSHPPPDAFPPVYLKNCVFII